MQQKTGRPVQFEITPATRETVEAWIKQAGLKPDGYLFPSRVHASPHLGTRQYARMLDGWVAEIGLDPLAYGRDRLLPEPRDPQREAHRPRRIHAPGYGDVGR